MKVLRKEELGKEVAIVVGTRPGIIKFSSVIRAFQEEKVPFFIAHSGQHYSYNMDKQFFEELGLPSPRYTNDSVQNETLHGTQTAEIIKALEKAFLESKPMIVIVGGDANTNLAGALAARKLAITVAHMEAGLRSNDWTMPEEHNRVMIDHISEILFTPTEETRQNLIEDNVKGSIYVVGNSIVDAVYQNIEIANEKSSILKKLLLPKNDYFLITCHREENVDYVEKMGSFVEVIQKVADRFKKRIIFPIHPRTFNRLKHFSLWEKLKNIEYLEIIDAVGYLDFLKLISYAQLILTDSGGVQEESCILKVPCITLRDTTERPETIRIRSNIIAGMVPDKVLHAVKKMLEKDKNWKNPFGDGFTGKRIASTLKMFSSK